MKAAASSTPPDFEDAGNLRQQARAAGMDPNYWYPIEEVRRIKPETVVEIVFWKRSIALFRGRDGTYQAVEDRCAHRQLKLSLGDVQGCRLVCAYHGWEYGGRGVPPGCPMTARGEAFRILRSRPIR